MTTIFLAVALFAAAPGRFPYPPQMAGARVETYKIVGDTKLNLYIFSPANPKNAPAIVFFFGGGWTSGSPAQFEVQSRHLASRGMVAICADYRVASRHQVKPTQCLADARSAIRWVRANAARLGVDPNRIAAGGGSAGGHLAAAAAFISEFDEPGEDKTISARPDALVLFNPALVLAPIDDLKLDGFAAKSTAERFGTEPTRISPAHHVKPGGPPTIIFHGRADTTVPFVTAEIFAAKMKAVGNRCELHGYDDQPHGFFNRDPWQQKTLLEADKFFVSLGWLPAK
ncbi:MAG: alpha/beta hydrolase [Verrucomicrobiae bacterium]|nr:alpha/beta hydrolase [Verrucomicrobiae bacterium]